MCVNGLIRWIDVAGYFPDNKRLFQHAYIHGSYEIFLMIYYICLFWGNDNDDQNYLNYQDITKLIPTVDVDLKDEFIEIFFAKHHKFTLGMDDVAKQALLDDDMGEDTAKADLDSQDTLMDIEFDKWDKYFLELLYACNIDLEEINESFYRTEGELYNKMSS